MADHAATAPGASVTTPNVPPPTYDFLLEKFTALLDTLLEERDALIGSAPERLNDVVVRKEALCTDIAARQQSLLDALGPGTALPDSMSELRDLARRCRTENALNGRIASRARRTTRSLLNVLTGEPQGELYGRPGRERRAGPGHHLGSA